MVHEAGPPPGKVPVNKTHATLHKSPPHRGKSSSKSSSLLKSSSSLPFKSSPPKTTRSPLRLSSPETHRNSHSQSSRYSSVSMGSSSQKSHQKTSAAEAKSTSTSFSDGPTTALKASAAPFNTFDTDAKRRESMKTPEKSTGQLCPNSISDASKSGKRVGGRKGKKQPPLSATTLYLATLRYVLQADLTGSSSSSGTTTWQELYKLLPYTRQALGCCVCARLVVVPYCAAERSCMHNVCRSCLGGKMRLKPACMWCKNHENYVENKPLRQVVMGFKRLCAYLMTTPVYRGLQVNGSVNSPLADIVREVAAFQDPNPSEPTSTHLDHVFSVLNIGAGGSASSGQAGELTPQPKEPSSPNKRSPATTSPKKRTKPFDAGGASTWPRSRKLVRTDAATTAAIVSADSPTPATRVRNSLGGATAPTRGTPTYRVVHLSEDGDKPKLMIRRKRSPEGVVPNTPKRRRRSGGGEGSSQPRRRQQRRQASSTTAGAARAALVGGSGGERSGCRCGFATASPGKLTCCGQRCPCYVGRRQCRECACRGCRNPYSSEGTKILAFASEAAAAAGASGTPDSTLPLSPSVTEGAEDTSAF